MQACGRGAAAPVRPCRGRGGRPPARRRSAWRRRCGAAGGAPARARTSRSNLALRNTLSTVGSASSGASAAIAGSAGTVRALPPRRRGRAGRSRRAPGAVASEKPTSLARMASSPSVSVSSATTPAAVASAIQACSAASVVTRVIGAVARRRPRFGQRGRPGGRLGEGERALAATGLRRHRRGRRGRLLQPEAEQGAAESLPASQAANRSRSGWRTASAASGTGRGASSRSSPVGATAAPPRRGRSARPPLRRLHRRRRRRAPLSRSPNSVMSWAAVLGPMPGTPGTLSTAVAHQRLQRRPACPAARPTFPPPRPGRSASA